jgi:hypothetical protein
MILLRADQIQPIDDTARTIGEAAEAPVARLIGQTIDAIAASLHAPSLARAIGENRFDALWNHLALERFGAALRPALNRLAVAHDRSAIAASTTIAKARPSRLVTPDVINLTYDPLNAATVAAQNAGNEAIAASIEATAQATAADIIGQGLARGLDPALIAQSVIDGIGLSPGEARAVESYRTALTADTLNALARALRDRRFDAATRAGRLNPEQIDRLVSRYAARYRAFHAARIARTEALRAANQGRRAAYAQYSALTGRDLRRFWLTAGDELVCPICAAIPGMNPEGVAMDEPYQTPIGPLMIPPDPHPLCRCSERYTRLGSADPLESPTSGGVGLRVTFDYA